MGIGKEIGEALGSAAGGAVSSGVGPIADLVRAAVVRIWPDPAQQSDALFKLRELEQSGDLQEMATRAGIMQAQIVTNQAEAASSSLFVAGWRPFIGWVCGGALAYQFVCSPIALWVADLMGHPLPAPPSLGGMLWELMFGMLGIGALRTVEKVKGVA